MHCPNCGKHSAEQAKYCRICGNDLEIVSQAIKGRLPLLIASKLDQILDSRSERLRRDSLLGAVICLTVLSGGLVSWLTGYSGLFSHPPFFLVVTLLLALASALEYVAYRRSLSADFNWTNLNREDGETLQTIYCPVCGKGNARDAHRCGVCSANLEVIANALEPRKKNQQTARLDSYIRWRDKNLDNTSQMFVFTVMMSCLWVVLAISMITAREAGWWFYLLMAAILLLTGAWDRVTYRRNSTDNEPRSPNRLSSHSNVLNIESRRNDRLHPVEFVSVPAEGELARQSSNTESTTRDLENDTRRQTDPLRKHAAASDQD